MAKRHSTYSGLIPAVAYVRRSTNKQDKSLAEQRAEIERYANANGYTIVSWYEDDAVSGDATECRYGFLDMHKKATNGRDFDVVLCWDSDRFGRFNSIEAGYWIHPLMKAGVRLVTVTEGPVNWDDFSGRIVHAVKQEGKHQFLVDLSRNVARGMTGVARKGFLCGQAAPYGFDRMLIDESGKHRQRIRNGERFSKPRGWRTTLVASDDPQKAFTVRWLFETYANTDTGLRSLADQLNARGVLGLSGGAWYAASIKAILENQNYTGTFTWAKRREGKYHSATGNDIRQRDRSEVVLSPAGKPLAIDNPEADWIVVDDAHESLIDKAVFQQVQQKMHKRRRSAPNAGYRTHTKQNGDVYVLSGLVFCARCGCKMHGSTLRVKKDGNSYQYPKYICSTYARSGKNNPSGCGCHGAAQDVLLGAIIEKLKENLLSGDGLTRFKTAVRRNLESRPKPSRQDDKALRKQLSQLNKDIELAADNYLRAPTDLLEIIGAKLSGMKRQRENLAACLREAERPVKEIDIDRETEEAAKRLIHLGREIEAGTLERQRELFGQIIDRIELQFDKVQRGAKTLCPFRSGQILLKTGENSIFGSVSRGDWPSFERVVATVVDAALSPNAETIVAHRVVRLSA